MMGILAVIAVTSYSRLTNRARVEEALDMVKAIHLAQNRFFAENSVSYANISQDLQSTYPAASPGAFRTAWYGTCSNCKTGRSWNELPITVKEAQMFGYATVAGPGGASDTMPSYTWGGASQQAPQQPGPWYAIAAVGDTNGDGTFCRIYSFSWDVRARIENEGE
jgi:Tfp pilus assembly protein PilE